MPLNRIETLTVERRSATRGRLRRLVNRLRRFAGFRRTPGAVVFHAQACGLSNRLRALVGYQALASLRKVPFYLCWDSDAACPCRFEDLFESRLRLLDASELEQLDDSTVFHDAIWFGQIWNQRAETFLWQEYLQEVHRCLRALIPRRELREPVKEFAARHDLGKALGVHIRNTDNLRYYEKWATNSATTSFDSKKISSLDGFIEVIRTAITTSPVLLVTDDAALEEQLKMLFPSLISFPKPYTPTGSRTTSIEVALSEMLLLGQCQQIVGTYYSSFSEFSAVWCGVDYFEMRGRECVRCGFVDEMRQP